MQWILLLAGLFIGAVLDGSLQGCALGALLGLNLGLSRDLFSLNQKSAEIKAALSKIRKELQGIQQRIGLLESTGNAPLNAAPEIPLDVQPVATVAPELTWTLPAPEPIVGHTGSGWLDTPPSEPRRSAETPTKTRPAPKVEESGEIYPLQAFILRAKEWLMGGNTVLRVGVMLLFLGLAFLLRYATEQMVVPLEARYAGVGLAAVALLGLGQWLCKRNPAFALMMQGTGVAVLYLTLFAAMKVHALLPPGITLGLLLAVTVFSAVLAVRQNSLALAAVAALGGFAAPILTSSGGGSHVALFSYFVLLNAGIFAIAWFKAWRALNLIGFIGTFGIGLTWGLKAYTPALFWSTEPFLILFFLMYLAIGLLFARRKLNEHATGPENDSQEAVLRWSARQSHYVDGTLLLGTPIVGFGLQYELIRHIEFGISFSALALGLLYIGIARMLTARGPQGTQLLVEACLSLGVVFATLAIPLGLSAHWTTMAWAVEGAAVFWLGLRQHRLLAQGFGLVLQLGAALGLLVDNINVYAMNWDPHHFWMPMTVALAGWISAFCADRIGTLRLKVSRQALQSVLLAWGALWWALALIGVSNSDLLSFIPEIPLLLLLSALTVIAWMLVALRLNWSGLAQLCSLLTPTSLVLLAINTLHAVISPYYIHPAADMGWLGWLAVLVAHLWSLRSLQHLTSHRLNSIAHVLGCWLIIGVLALELRYGLIVLSDDYSAWRWLGWALVPSLYLLAMASPRSWPWPIATNKREYRIWAAAPLAGLMMLWFWLANSISDGDADPLPYIPLINPLELGLLISLAAVLLWARRHLPQLGVSDEPADEQITIIAGASLFAFVTAAVMRTAHHWANVPWHTDALMESMSVQAGLSIVWTLLALALMIGGYSRARRDVWIVGAALIGVVVAKLFFVELSNRGSLERIVSFIGVGVLLLVVGYFAPLPPKGAAPTSSSTDSEPTDPAQPHSEGAQK